MARVKQVSAPPADSIVPPELAAWPTVRDWNPEAYDLHHGVEPSSTSPAWFGAICTARRRHRQAWQRWVADTQIDPGVALRHHRGRRPIWD